MSDSLFAAVSKYAPVGLMLLDEDARVIHLNAFLKTMLSLPASRGKGLLFGCALHCASASGAGRPCGEMPVCGSCHLRRSIINALKHDHPAQYAVLNHTFIIDSTPTTKSLRFSASAVETKQGRCVLVSIVDMTREQQCERLLARELDLEATPDIINPQNLVGIVAGLLQKAGPDSAVSVGMAALEGLEKPGEHSGMTKDDALNRFIEIARQCTRRQDIIGRCNGSSFVFIFSGVGVHTAAAISRRIHDTMCAVFGAYDARGISFSVGFMELKTSDIPTVTSAGIIRTVETCLSAAQRRGRSVFVSRELTTRLKD